MNEIEKLIDELAEAYFPERAIGAIVRSDYESALRRVANAAVQGERERCAQIAELTSKEEFQGRGLAAMELFAARQRESKSVAAAIRKGTQE